MADMTKTSSAALRQEKKSPSRGLWLWIALSVCLVAAFLLDGVGLELVRPWQGTHLTELVHQLIRPLGVGQTQALVVLALLAIGLWRPDARRAAGRVALALASSALAVNLLKVLIHRPRPWVEAPHLASWWAAVQYSARESELRSFPSAESATTFAVAWTLIGLYPRGRVPLLIAAVLVAAGRVVVGAHHPSDVVAGAMLGMALAEVALGRVTLKRRLDWRNALPLLLLAAYAALALFTGLGHLPLFGRDESLYAEAAREMYVSGDWITPRVNGVPFLEKPPLNYWLVAASYHLFGVSPLAARLPAALLGLLTVMLTAMMGARVWGRRAGALAGLALASCLQLAFIGRMGIMDVPLTCLTLLALLAYAAWRSRGGLRDAVTFGALVGAAVLLKSLAGLLPALVAIAHSLWHARESRRPWVAAAGVAIAVAAAVAVPWFAAVATRHPAFLTTFVRENFTRMGEPMQGHGGSLLLYLPSYPALILFGFFPWVVFLPSSMGRRHGTPHQLWRGLAVTWFWVVLGLFTLISTKLPGYVTPLYPAMALLVGAEMDRRLEAPGRGVWIGMIVGAVAMAALGALLPFLGARLGERVGAAEEAQRLVTPAHLWAGASAVIALGAALALARRTRLGLGVVAAGQTAFLAVVLAGILPLLTPFLEGSREYRLAQLAQQQLPGAEVVLYETWPEAVNFALGHPVRVFWDHQGEEVTRYLRNRNAALIAPAESLPAGLRMGRRWQVGDYALVEVHR